VLWNKDLRDFFGWTRVGSGVKRVKSQLSMTYELYCTLHENFGRPSGTRISLPLFPALKRRAIGRCPSGAAFFCASFHEAVRKRVLTHTPKELRSASKIHRTGFINAFEPGRHLPQGLKPACLLALGGTAEAVPFPRTIYETSFRSFASLRMTEEVMLRTYGWRR
jgi:hypothetical protein